MIGRDIVPKQIGCTKRDPECSYRRGSCSEQRALEILLSIAVSYMAFLAEKVSQRLATKNIRCEVVESQNSKTLSIQKKKKKKEAILKFGQKNTKGCPCRMSAFEKFWYFTTNCGSDCRKWNWH